jgi:diketogulonate reductase-like aldo/keto reductase
MGSFNIQSECSLNDGTKIPYLGLGVYACSTCLKACLTSFEEGYRQIDTAQLYENEAEVGVRTRLHTSPDYN